MNIGNINSVLTGPAITAGLNPALLGLDFAILPADTYLLGEDNPYLIPPFVAPRAVLPRPVRIGTTPVTNGSFERGVDQLGSKNTVFMGSLPDGGMILLARGSLETICGLSQDSIRAVALRSIQGGVETFDIKGPIVIKAKYSKDIPAMFRGPLKPVVRVSWYVAKAWALLFGYDLLKEEVWEAAGRGKGNRRFPTATGDLYDPSGKHALHFEAVSTADVGSYPPIRVGGVNVYDMGGNVWEWTDSRGKGDNEDKRVVRGGSWNSESPISLYSGHGKKSHPDTVANNLGFRCGASAPLD